MGFKESYHDSHIFAAVGKRLQEFDLAIAIDGFNGLIHNCELRLALIVLLLFLPLNITSQVRYAKTVLDDFPS